MSKKQPADEGFTGDQFRAFREALQMAAEKVKDDRKLQDRYPPELLAEMESASQQIMNETMEAASGSFIDPDRETHLELMIESDRGCVLIAASWMDELVLDICRDMLCSGTEEMNKAGGLLLAGHKAPLGDSWSRETFLFATGAISAQERDGLSALRKLRNRYAHRKTPAVITVDDLQPLWSTFSERVRAKFDVLGDQLGLIFQVAADSDDMPFGARFSPSTAKLKFVLAFSALKTSIQTARIRAPLSAALTVIRTLIEQRRKASEASPDTTNK